MSEEMAPSWRSLASAASRSIKGYIAQQRDLKQAYPASRGAPPPGSEQPGKRQTWTQWAGQKLRRGTQDDNSGDRLTLFPGWATRRYREPPRAGEDDTPFDIDVFVSGYAYKLTGVGFNTRAGRAFLRLAKSFAALPKLPMAPGVTKSTEDLLASAHLPPLPDEMTEEEEMRMLEENFRRLESDAQSMDSNRTSDAYSMRSSDSRQSRATSATSATSVSSNYSSKSFGSSLHLPDTPPPPLIPGSATDLQRWHANLEARLHPFWSSVLANRTVRVSLYAVDPSLFDGRDSESSGSSNSPEDKPITTREVLTAVDGSFQVKLSIPWEHMCVHPGALHIAFGGSNVEQDLFVNAELLAPPVPTPSPAAAQYQYQPEYCPPPPSVTAVTSMPITLTHASVRVISDIDDTVKLSGILGGARAVFHNVFVKDLRESVIRGMGDWYTGMWKRGVRFHYVSNGPFELLPVVNEFMQISRLPPGSIRLRSYGGRSLFNGLLSAPAMRKRTAVLDVLNHFPEAEFFLVGDSGEQDLELYAEIARERPSQILAIFIRDASSRDSAVPPLDDPTGDEAFRADFASRPGTPTSTSGRISGTFGRRSGRSTPVRSLSEAQAQSPLSGLPGSLPRRSRRSGSGSYSIPETLGPSSSASSGEMSDYFSSNSAAPGPGPAFASRPPVNSPITEEPHESPPMMLPTPNANANVNGGRSWPPPGFAQSAASQTEFGLEERESRDGRWQPRPQAMSPSSSYTSQAPLSDAEKKRFELQMRLWRARYEVPHRIPIRVFREPEECVEVDEILQARGR